jgi:hypothetical protein
VKVAAAPGAGVNRVSVEKAKPLVSLALLPHCAGSVDAPTPLAPMTPALDPDKTHGPLQQAFEAELEKLNDFMRSSGRTFDVPDLLKVPMALVDLTANPRAPRLAGFNLTASRHPASTSKLACLFAAHQLRFDLQVLATSGARRRRRPPARRLDLSAGRRSSRRRTASSSSTAPRRPRAPTRRPT